MPRTPKKTVAQFDSFWLVVKNFFLAIWNFVKILARAVLILLDKIFRLVIALILAVAKIIRAVALAFVAVFLALALLALTFFLFAKAIDLPSSENFQKLRERTLAILLEAAEPDFIAWETNTRAWIDYRAELAKLAESSLTPAEKQQKLEELRAKLHKQLETCSPHALERELSRDD
ncbi:MAG: hypothetical protein V1936_00810 [Patescibacteria group bacterium]